MPAPWLHSYLFGSAHSCTSNLRLRYSSAPLASRMSAVGVKNLRWHLAHEANAATLTSYRRTTKRPSVYQTGLRIGITHA